MKVLVTGGAGFIGSHIVDLYIKEGYEVVIVDNLSTGKSKYINKEAKFYEADINTKEFNEIVDNEKPDIINHHAAQIDVATSIKEPVTDAHINILGTINVLEASKAVNAKLIYASSAAVYGEPEYLGIDEKHPVNPLSTYGISKHTPEHYIVAYSKLYDLEYMIFRYSNVYGERQDPKGEGGVISILTEKSIKDTLFTVFGDGEQTRDYIHVSDIAAANLLATKQFSNEIINISTGIPVTLNDAIKEFENAAGKKIELQYGDARKGDIKHSYLLNEKAHQVIGFEPKISLAEGLRKTYDYYKQQTLS